MDSVKKSNSKIGRKGDLIFHWALLIWPLLQFGVFYIGVNLNSLLLAFKNETGSLSFSNFSFVFSEAMFPGVWNSIKTSLMFYVITTVISVPLGLLFAYYIYKKLWGGKLFRFFLFLPSIVSGMVMVVLYHKFLDNALGDMLYDIFGWDITESLPLITNSKYSSYIWIIIFHIWISFGTTTLIYSNKMGEISPEMIEAGKLDGATSMQEFAYIVLPSAFSTVSVFLVTGVATLFVNQYNLFSFFGAAIGFDAGTMGYYLFNGVQDVVSKGAWDSIIFNRYAALSILVTIIIVPITLTARWALDKFGPQD